MPSRAQQGVRVIKNKNPRKPGSYILISKRTGFMDVWINGRHFAYNYQDSYQMGSKQLDMDKIVLQVTQKQQNKKRPTIIISKRSG